MNIFALASNRSRLALVVAIVASGLTGCFDRTEILPLPDPDGSVDTSDGGDGGDTGIAPPPPFATGVDIRDITTDGERLFWVEYGTKDGLGNTLDDGTLRARPLEGGATETIANGLTGPVAVTVTQKYAYVILAEHPAIGGGRHAAVQRVPLEGGTSVILEDGRYLNDPIVVGGAHAYWQSWDNSTSNIVTSYALGDHEVSPSEIAFAGSVPRSIEVIDGSFMYLRGQDGQIYRSSLTGGATELIAPYSNFELDIDNAQIYSFDYDHVAGMAYLTRSDLGVTATRIARLGPHNPFSVEIEDGWFYAEFGSGDGILIVGAPLSDPQSNRMLAPPGRVVAWTASKLGVFTSDGTRIVLLPRGD